jgi:hypothetical protein
MMVSVVERRGVPVIRIGGADSHETDQIHMGHQ